MVLTSSIRNPMFLLSFALVSARASQQNKTKHTVEELRQKLLKYRAIIDMCVIIH